MARHHPHGVARNSGQAAYVVPLASALRLGERAAIARRRAAFRILWHELSVYVKPTADAMHRIVARREYISENVFVCRTHIPRLVLCRGEQHLKNQRLRESADEYYRRTRRSQTYTHWGNFPY